jgi:hypothetical protein
MYLTLDEDRSRPARPAGVRWSYATGLARLFEAILRASCTHQPGLTFADDGGLLRRSADGATKKK